MNLGDRLKAVGLFWALFFLSLYLPFVLVTYFPSWYHLNCQWYPHCENIGSERAISGINDLTSFFWHEGELAAFSTQKEKLHLSEVRKIFDSMFVVFVMSLLLLILTFDRRAIARCALVSMGILSFCLALSPFFTTLWRDVHPLLFDNELWKNNRSDLSYYLMPNQFFKYTMLLLIASSFLFNVLIWFRFRK